MNKRQHLIKVGLRNPWGQMGIVGGQTYAQKLINLFGSSIIGYWPMTELAGTAALDVSGNSRNGTYSGVDLNNVLSKVGKPAPLFGTGDYLNVYSTSLRDAFNAAEGTFIAWVKVSAVGVWTDAAARHVCEFRADTSNRLFIRRSATNSKLEWTYIAGGITVGAAIVVPPDIDWMRLALTWSKSGDKMIGYMNGAWMIENTVSLGTWVGALASTNAEVGAANTSGALPWSGWITDAILLNRAATVKEIISDYQTSYLERTSILGDSVPNDPSEWPYYVQQARPTMVIQNHAVPGHSITLHLATQVTASASDQSKNIIITLGTNDDNAGNMATLQATIEDGIIALKASNSQARIYYMGVLPRWTDTGGGTPVDKSHIRTAQAAACTAQGATYWDTFTDPWIAANQTTDGLHPLAAGHVLIADRIAALLA